MPQILPLRGIRYTESAGPLGDVIAPPYDVISPEQQQVLVERNPHNAVRLELAEGGEERYQAVARLLEDWLEAGVLARDDVPMLYVYVQRFAHESRERERRALIAGVEAQAWEEGAVKPHEYTMSGPKEDRLKLLQATRTQFSPTFMLARDRAGQLRQFLEETIASRAPDAEGASIDGEHHRLWAVEAGRYEMRQLAPLLAESFYIADGHHRYETAVTFKHWTAEHEGTLARDHPARFAMTAVVPVDDPGLLIRPIHRFVAERPPGDWQERLAPVFDVRTAGDATADAIDGALADDPRGIVAVGLDQGRVHVLQPRDDADLAALGGGRFSADWMAIEPNLVRHGVLGPLWGISDEDLRLGKVEYLHTVPEVVEALDERPEGVAFLLHPVDVEDVLRLADKGERLPQKSTFFHPKVGTGLVFNPLYR